MSLDEQEVSNVRLRETQQAFTNLKERLSLSSSDTVREQPPVEPRLTDRALSAIGALSVGIPALWQILDGGLAAHRLRIQAHER